MMFQDNSKQSDGHNFSHAMQRRIEAMQQNADTLFSIGWLRKRLWKDLGSRICEVQPTEYYDYSRVLQGSYDSVFIWEFLSTYRKSYSEIKRITDNAFAGKDTIVELLEKRDEKIREFACMPLSRNWEYVEDDDQSWRKFARRMPLNNPDMRKDVARFFETLDYISIVTDIVCHRADEYGLKVDYSSMEAYDLEQRRAALTDEALVRAIESVSYHLASYSAWVVVYCVLRDDYGYQNQSQFERDVVALPFRKHLEGCPKGTVSKTMSNHDYLYSPIDKWPPDSKFTKFATDLRAAIKSELSK